MIATPGAGHLRRPGLRGRWPRDFAKGLISPVLRRWRRRRTLERRLDRRRPLHDLALEDGHQRVASILLAFLGDLATAAARLAADFLVKQHQDLVHCIHDRTNVAQGNLLQLVSIEHVVDEICIDNQWTSRLRIHDVLG